MVFYKKYSILEIKVDKVVETNIFHKKNNFRISKQILLMVL